MISMFQVKVRILNATMHVPLSMECCSCKPCINSTVFLIFSIDFFVIAFLSSCWSHWSCSISKMLRLFGCYSPDSLQFVAQNHMRPQNGSREKPIPNRRYLHHRKFANRKAFSGQNTLETNWLIRKWVLLYFQLNDTQQKKEWHLCVLYKWETLGRTISSALNLVHNLFCSFSHQ